MIKPKRASNNSASRLTRLYQASRSTTWKKIARNRSSLLFSRDESANNASSDQLKRKISLIVKIRTNSNDTITFIFKVLLTRVFDTHFIDNLSTSENKKCSLESIQGGGRWIEGIFEPRKPRRVPLTSAVGASRVAQSWCHVPATYLR